MRSIPLATVGGRGEMDLVATAREKENQEKSGESEHPSCYPSQTSRRPTDSCRRQRSQEDVGDRAQNQSSLKAHPGQKQKRREQRTKRCARGVKKQGESSALRLIASPSLNSRRDGRKQDARQKSGREHQDKRKHSDLAPGIEIKIRPRQEGDLKTDITEKRDDCRKKEKN